MNKSLMGLLFMSTISTTAIADYWDYRQVCDYERVEVSSPITQCHYMGHIYGWVGNSYSSQWASESHQSEGHTSCSQGVSSSSHSSYYDNQTREWVNVSYSGTITLVSQNHTQRIDTITQQVEGSCRMERVRIVTCPNCQIP
jgi:hypothetical protein